MNRFLNYCLVFSCLLVCSCRTLKERDFTVNESLPTIIPPLEGRVDLYNLKQNISFGTVKLSGYYNGIMKVPQESDSVIIIIEDPNFNKRDQRMNPDIYYTKAEYKPDARINDIIRLFAKEVNGSSSQQDTLKRGTIQLEILSYKEKKNVLLTIFSIWTLCVPTLIGVPLNSINSSVDIQVTIFNQQKQSIGKFKASGNGTAYIAMYWGYGSDAHRKSAMIAFSDAMVSIKEQIKNNKNQLTSELTKK